jgi:hypothetical protein
MIQKVQTALNFSKKKKFEIRSKAGSTAEPNRDAKVYVLNLVLLAHWS